MSSPLLARPGARFECFSDGLCCTDVHALGPLSRGEAKAMRALVKGSVFHQDNVDALCMKPGPDGTCAQREAGLCGVHKRFGAAAKPSGCRRFPYGLLSTPEGQRVTTEHRCPCRTLGERRPLSLKDAARSLSDGKGTLEVDHWAPEQVPVAAEQLIPFAEYRVQEEAMIRRLLAGEAGEDVLCAEVLPALYRQTWDRLADGFDDPADTTAGGAALAWFGDALRFLIDGRATPARGRPWAASFARAISRSRRRERPEKILNDWLADELWMMRWNDWDCTFDVARAELATRLAVVRRNFELLHARGVRADQAAAEAVMIAEISACAEHWGDVVNCIANDPSPAAPL